MEMKMFKKLFKKAPKQNDKIIAELENMVCNAPRAACRPNYRCDCVVIQEAIKALK